MKFKVTYRNEDSPKEKILIWHDKNWWSVAHEIARKFRQYCVSDFDWKGTDDNMCGIIPIDDRLYIKISKVK